MRWGLVFSFLLAFSHTGAQHNFSRYVDYEFYPKVDFHHYREAAFKWDFEGKLQAMVNAGITELKEENYLRAITHLDEAIQKDPELWVSYYYRGICHKITANLDQAIKDLELAKEKSEDRTEIFIELGEIYQSQRDLDKAHKCFDRARDLAPDEVDGYFGIANVAFIKMEVDKAIRFYKKCNEVNPKFPDAYLKIALLKLVVNNKEKQAMTYMDQAIEADPMFQEGLFWRGLMNIEFNNTQKALQDWTRLLELNPKHAYYTLIRGFLYIELNDFEKAFTDLKNAILNNEVDENQFEFGKTVLNKQIDLHAASTYLMRNVYGLEDSVAAPLKKGFCYMLAGKNTQAVTALNISVQRQPSSSAYLLKAMAHEYIKQHDSAFLYYDKTLSLDNEIFDAHKKRAIYRTQIKDWKGASRDFIEMERLLPESILIYKLRGTLKYGQKDFWGATVDFSKYLKKDSLNEEIIELLAGASQQVGNFQIAKNEYTKLIRLNPKHNQACEQLYITNLLMKDTTAALQTLEDYYKQFPFLSFSYIQKMEILIARKQWNPVLGTYHIFNSVPYPQPAVNRSDALYLKGLAQSGLNQKEEAIKTFSEAIEIGLLGNYTNLDAYYQRGKHYWETEKRKKAIADFKKLRASAYTANAEFIDSVLSADE